MNNFKLFNTIPPKKPVLVNLNNVNAIQPGHLENITIFYFGTESEEDATYVSADFSEVCILLTGQKP